MTREAGLRAYEPAWILLKKRKRIELYCEEENYVKIRRAIIKEKCADPAMNKNKKFILSFIPKRDKESGKRIGMIVWLINKRKIELTEL